MFLNIVYNLKYFSIFHNGPNRTNVFTDKQNNLYRWLFNYVGLGPQNTWVLYHPTICLGGLVVSVLASVD
jgi:hypothetical protein